MPQGAAEGIGEGIGQGLDTIANQMRFNQQQKLAERDKQADALTEQIHAIADNIQRVGGPKTPEAVPLIEQLNAVVKQHNALFAPHESGALIDRLKAIGSKRTRPMVIDPRAGMTPDAAMATAQRPPYNTTDEYLTHQNELQGKFARANAPIQTQITLDQKNAMLDWGRKNGLSDQQISELTATLAGIPASVQRGPNDPSGQWEEIPGHFADGSPGLIFKSGRTGEITDINGNAIPPEKLAGFVKQVGTAPKNKQAWIIRDGKPLSVMLDPQNHPIPGTENPDAVPPPSLFGRITTTDFITDDGFGNIVSIPKTTVSSPVGVAPPSRPGAAAPGAATPPGGTPGAQPFKSPGEARAAMQPPEGPRPGPTIVGSKATSSQKTAQTDYDKAVGMVALADAAARNPSALTDKNLAIALARNASGRFSIAEYDIMIRNAGLGNSFEQWMNNIESGKLTDNIRNQLIQVAKNNALAAKAALDSAGGGATPSNKEKDPLDLGL